MCEHEGDDSLLGLGLPLADHTCKDTTEEKNISLQVSASSRQDDVSHLFHTSNLGRASIKMLKNEKNFSSGRRVA